MTEKLKAAARFLLALATVLSSAAALVTAVKAKGEVQAADKDRAYLWDDHGDQIAEVELLKERLAALEKGSKR